MRRVVLGTAVRRPKRGRRPEIRARGLCNQAVAVPTGLKARGLAADPQYSSFYSCDELGKPLVRK
jgi:hypothetical protein